MSKQNTLSNDLLSELFWGITVPLAVVSGEKECVLITSRFAEFFRSRLSSAGAEEALKAIPELWVGLDSLDIGSGDQETELLLDGFEDPVEIKCHLKEISENFFLVSFSQPHERESLFHQQRLQTLGLLSGGVAHDFNNILAGILGHITFLQAVLPVEGAHQESLQAITEGAKRASTLTGQILDFSRFEVSEAIEVIDLSSLVKSTALLLRGALTSAVELELDVPDEEILVHGIEGKIAQILVNLVINARDALTQNGKVKVVIRGPIPSGSDLEKECATITVVDNGCGMSKEIQERAFETYFSTKGAEGTGLGLATVLSIVEEHGGTIEIDSEIDEGTEIKIFLRSADNTPAQSGAEKGASQVVLPTGEEQILVIDDEDSVRNVVTMSLKHLGYSVVDYADPREAAEAINSENFCYDLVVLDMLMPHLSGEDLFFQLRGVFPDMPVLIMSGYSEEGAINRVLEQPSTSFIQKPFTVEDLALCVRKGLDSE